MTEAERVRQLQAEARADYERTQSPTRRAAARELLGHARTHGNHSAGSWRGRK